VSSWASIVKSEAQEADPARFRLPCVTYRLQLDAISGLLSDPRQWLVDRYQSGAAVAFEALFSNLQRLLLVQTLPSSVQRTPSSALAQVTSLDSAIVVTPGAPSHMLSTELFSQASDNIDVVLRLMSLPGAGGPGTTGLGATLTPRKPLRARSFCRTRHRSSTSSFPMSLRATFAAR
jgi:hypothetical protein